MKIEASRVEQDFSHTQKYKHNQDRPIPRIIVIIIIHMLTYITFYTVNFVLPYRDLYINLISRLIVDKNYNNFVLCIVHTKINLTEDTQKKIE